MTTPLKKKALENELVRRSVFQPRRPLDISMLLPRLDGNGWRASTRQRLNKLLGVARLIRLFEDVQHEQNPFLAVLEKLDIQPETGDLVEEIPEKNPCIVVANHPNGGSDALTLVGKAVERRGDVKVLANSILMGLPGVAKWMIPLDIMGEHGATRRNQVALKEALVHLRAGGLLMVFPAGTLSYWRADRGGVADPEWSDHIVRLAMNAHAPVLPVRIFEKNPSWFTLLGATHLHVRSALVPRLLFSSRGKKLVCRAGKMVRPQVLTACDHASQATDVIRRSVQKITAPTDS